MPGTLLQHPTLRNEFLVVSMPRKTPQGADKTFRLNFDKNGQTVVSDGVLDEIALAQSLGFMPDVLTKAGEVNIPDDLGKMPPGQTVGRVQLRDGRMGDTIGAVEWGEDVQARERLRREQKTLAARARAQQARYERDTKFAEFLSKETQ